MGIVAGITLVLCINLNGVGLNLKISSGRALCTEKSGSVSPFFKSRICKLQWGELNWSYF